MRDRAREIIRDSSDETLAVEGRAVYYDGVAALTDVLRSIRPLSDDDVVRNTRRARDRSG